jgi:hypothetical protein
MGGFLYNFFVRKKEGSPSPSERDWGEDSQHFFF